jgi:TetR/AcrR family transcriptional repressor of nem operon
MTRIKTFDKEKIVEKAAVFFWHKGYNGASMQELVEYIGLSRSSIYDTYGDKHQLYLDALRKYQENLMTYLIETFATAPDVKTAIQEILITVVNESKTDTLSKGCFLVNSAVELGPHDSDIGEIIRTNLNQLETLFSTQIATGQQMGHVSKKQDPTVLANFLINTITGLRVGAKSNVTEKSLLDSIDIAISVL